jgi:hypothetical protein
MKKRVPSRKLALNRETIAALQEENLPKVGGGGVTGVSYCTPCQTGTRCNISLCICD